MNISAALLFLGTVTLLSALGWAGVLIMAIAGTGCGVRIREISFGTGKPAISFPVGRATVTFAPLITSAHLKFSDNRHEGQRDVPSIAMDSRPPIVRFLILASCMLAYFLFGFLTLGVDGTRLMWDAIPQLVRGALSPGDHAQGLLAAYVEMARTVGVTQAFGLIAIKAGTFYLVPISPTLGMGQALAAMSSKPLVDYKYMLGWSIFTYLATVALAASWLWAMVKFVVSP